MIHLKPIKFTFILGSFVLAFIFCSCVKENVLGQIEDDPVEPGQNTSVIYSVIHYDSAVTQSWISLPYNVLEVKNPLVEFVFIENDSLQIAYFRGDIVGDTLVLHVLDRYYCDCTLTQDTLKANCVSDSLPYSFSFFFTTSQDTLYLRTASADAEGFFSAYGLINGSPFLRMENKTN
jgi:hypothetical protein